jgi:hypothetical protein
VWVEDHSTADFSLVPVTLDHFAAGPAEDGIRVTWSVPSDARGLLFHVYRAAGPASDRVRLTSEPLSGGPDYVFLDRDVISGRDYAYWLMAVVADGKDEFFGPLQISFASPGATRITSIVPNPFRSSVAISFHLATPGMTSLRIFDVAGRLVRTLHEDDLPAGDVAVAWDGRDDRGGRASPGVYHAAVAQGGRTWTSRVVLAR